MGCIDQFDDRITWLQVQDFSIFRDNRLFAANEYPCIDDRMIVIIQPGARRYCQANNGDFGLSLRISGQQVLIPALR